jgi:hypothetical protein
MVRTVKNQTQDDIQGHKSLFLLVARFLSLDSITVSHFLCVRAGVGPRAAFR